MSDRPRNPYVIYCPHCGETICAKCEQYEAQAMELSDCEADRKFAAGMYDRRRRHLERYDHSGVTQDAGTFLSLGLNLRVDR